MSNLDTREVLIALLIFMAIGAVFNITGAVYFFKKLRTYGYSIFGSCVRTVLRYILSVLIAFVFFIGFIDTDTDRINIYLFNLIAVLIIYVPAELITYFIGILMTSPAIEDEAQV